MKLIFFGLVSGLADFASSASESTSTASIDSKIIDGFLLHARSTNVPEGGFFDSTSMDMEDAFSSFIVNTHPLYKDMKLSYTLSSSGQNLNANYVDLDLYENCLAINSHFLSKGLEAEVMERKLKGFWDNISVFRYMKFDEKSQRWALTDEIPEIDGKEVVTVPVPVDDEAVKKSKKKG